MSHPVTIYNFGFSHHDADWNFRISGSVFWRVYMVTEGEAQVRIYDDVHPLSPGHLYLIPAYVPHEDMCSGSFGHYYLHFAVDSITLSEMAERYELPFEAPCPPLAVEVFRRLGEICAGFDLESCVPQQYEKRSSYQYWSRRYETLPHPLRLELEGYVQILLAHFMLHSRERKMRSHPAVDKGRLYIDSHFGDSILIDDVADIAGVRPETFARLFRECLGKSPHSYLMEKRLNAAKWMLQLSTYSIKEIAVRCGFGDASYFCLSFRRHEGMTPGEFRRSRR